MKLMPVEAIPTIQKKFPRKHIAFWVHDTDEGFSVLTVVVKDKQGHHPLPWQLAFGSHEQMVSHAEGLNDALGLTLMQAHQYIISSMQGAQTDRRRTS